MTLSRKWLCVFSAFCLLAAGALAAHGAGALERICDEFRSFDINGDGVVEIESLKPLDAGEGKEDENAPLLLVVVESRLLSRIPGAPVEQTDLTASLKRCVSDLRAAGWKPRLVAASVYSGPNHQDGRTLLAMRRFFQRVHAEAVPFAGAVLVGSFPEAFLVRSYNWRKRTKLTLNKGKPNEKKFEEPVDYLRTVAEPVAMRCELVLCDIDGDWEAQYHEQRRRLPSVIGVFPGGVPPEGGRCTDFERGGVFFEDFFYVNDGHFYVSEVVGPKQKDKEAEVVAIDFKPLDACENAECSPGDLTRRGNPLARPDILVSRINARHVALSPKKDVKGKDGEGLIGPDGLPQRVTFKDDKSVPRWLNVWEHDPVLERRLLIEYFERNHRYRKGEFAAHFKPAFIGHGLGNAFGRMKRAVPEWKDFAEEGYDAGTKATLLDVALWLKRPAVMRDLRAHSDPWGSKFGKPDMGKLAEAAGAQPWSWSKEGASLVPSLESACAKGKADFALYRTMWQNGVLPDTACFYFHQGCDGISPAHAADRPYNHPEYGYWQGAESLLFYVQGLALVGRAKVFYDEPRDFYPYMAQGKTFGEAWAHYFDAESSAANESHVGGGIGRKRSYFWSVLGDWTLRLKPPA